MLFIIFASLMNCENKEQTKTVNKLSNSINEVKIGEETPNFHFNYLLNGKTVAATLEDYKNSLIILDFWATWCGPCIKATPKMEKLQSEFGKKLKIILVSNEKKERITAFLSQNPINLPIILDSEGVFNDYFKHASIPHYVILDKNKIVKAITHGDYITSENISKLLKNERVNIPEKRDNMKFNPMNSLSNNTNNYLFQSILTPYRKDYPSMSNLANQGVYANRRIFVSNLGAAKLIEIAWQYPRTRVANEIVNKEKYDSKDKANRYCYELIVPESVKNNKFQIMQSEITKFFNLNVTVEKRKLPVFILKRDSNSKMQLKQSKSIKVSEKFVRYGERINIVNGPISDLCNYLENNLGKPIINETNLHENYDINIKWRNENPNFVHSELAKYGLALEKSEREIDILVIKD